MYRVLVVDDEPMSLRGVSRLIGDSGDFEVLMAESGQEALSKMERYRVDILVSDIEMPGISGLELLTKVKKRWPFAKVIMLTAYDDFTYIQTSMRQGADAYVLKSDGDAAIISALQKCADEIDKETIENGKKVSGFRRITLFFLDVFIYLCLSTIFSVFFKTLFPTTISFIIYYVIIPYFWNGKTIASNFLNVRVTFPNMKFIRLILKNIFNYFYYFLLPILILTIVENIVNNINFTVLSIWIYLGSFIFIMFFYRFSCSYFSCPIRIPI